MSERARTYREHFEPAQSEPQALLLFALKLPANAEYVDFLKNVFGAVETEQTETRPGRFHAEFRIGDSMLMLGVESGMKMPMSLEIYVPKVDDVYKRAIDGGCKALKPLQDAHWEDGLRLAGVEDQEGNVWSIASHFGKNYIPEGRDALHSTKAC